jgi:hypothetical protein
MTNQNLTDITIILDRSGSMTSVKADTVGGYNEFIKTQREAKIGECRVSLVQFDHAYESVYASLPVAEVPPLDFNPRGNTALLDAIGRTILATGERYAKLPEGERPGKVLIVIITDGQENSSEEFDNPKINALISKQRDEFAWDFLFLGANQDAFATSAQWGVAAGKTMTYAANDAGTAAAFASVGSYAVRSRGMASGAAATASNAMLPEDYDAQKKAGA